VRIDGRRPVLRLDHGRPFIGHVNVEACRSVIEAQSHGVRVYLTYPFFPFPGNRIHAALNGMVLRVSHHKTEFSFDTAVVLELALHCGSLPPVARRLLAAFPIGQGVNR
jgi:hypothetical protein